MKILVTVGTGAFDGLISNVSNSSLVSDNLIDIQYGSSSVNWEDTDSIRYFDYIDNIEKTYDQYDFIIAHCGAGTVFSLLEQGYSFVTVPNTERCDHHQLELAEYLKKNNYCSVCLEISRLPQLVQTYRKADYSTYEKEEFFLSQRILSLINRC